MYTRRELKKIIAKVFNLDSPEELQDVMIVVNFINTIYVLFGHPYLLSKEEMKIVREAYNDLETTQSFKD